MVMPAVSVRETVHEINDFKAMDAGVFAGRCTGVERFSDVSDDHATLSNSTLGLPD